MLNQNETLKQKIDRMERRINYMVSKKRDVPIGLLRNLDKYKAQYEKQLCWEIENSII